MTEYRPGFEGARGGFIDPREDFEGGSDDEDDAWIGEKAEGVWICRHPLAALADEPLLWAAWADWRMGVRELDPREVRRRSNFELEAFLALRAADSRQQVREMRRRRGDGD